MTDKLSQTSQDQSEISDKSSTRPAVAETIQVETSMTDTKPSSWDSWDESPVQSREAASTKGAKRHSFLIEISLALT